MCTIGEEEFSETQKKFDLIIQILGGIKNDLDCIKALNKSTSKSFWEDKKNQFQHERLQEKNCENVKETTNFNVKNKAKILIHNQQKPKIKKSKAKNYAKAKRQLKKNSTKVQECARFDLVATHSIFELILKLEETKRFRRKKTAKCDDGG